MRYSETEIERMIEEQEQSGKSIAEYCAGRGLERKTFYVWRQRAKKGSGRFVKVGGEKRVELELSGGVRLHVAVEDLAVVLGALR